MSEAHREERRRQILAGARRITPAAVVALADSEHAETRSRIAKAKEAAERGARLSQELIRQSKSGS